VGKVIADQSVSLDGFSAGPNVRMGNGMGDGGEGLHAWIFSEGGRTGRDGACSTSARSLGMTLRRSTTTGLRRHAPATPADRQAGRHDVHVRDGLEAALARARDAAGDRNAAVLGGAEIIRQCIRGGLLDELRLHVVHIVLGGGTALFGGLDPADVALERIGLIDADGATHLTFRLAR
jgi:riboflavin biosynthesis pyrimidine reductase